MSTFSGKMEEVPHVRVDNFDKFDDDEDLEAFFLSHCHSDHMRGLNEYTIRNVLVAGNKYLYASKVSCLILKKKFPMIENNLRILDMHSSTRIQIKDDIICVTSIPAGHCPGSIMMLFETSKGKTVLYTGDYRINPRDLEKFKGFYDSSDQLKTIYKIYLDTTFFLRSFQRFPTRDESMDKLCEMIKEWLEKDVKNVVNLDTGAWLGYEFLFLELYNRLKVPIHLNENAYNVYKYFPDLDKAVTTDGSNTRIHSFCINKHFKICKHFSREYYNVKYIKLSSFRWKNVKLKSGISENNDSGNSFVCYSTHASFEEGCGLIRFLKPKKIVPCVEANTEEERQEMHDSIRMILKEFEDVETNSDVSEPEKISLFPLNKSKNLMSSYNNEVDETILRSPPRMMENESFDDSCILDSPPRKMMKEDT